MRGEILWFVIPAIAIEGPGVVGRGLPSISWMKFARIMTPVIDDTAQKKYAISIF